MIEQWRMESEVGSLFLLASPEALHGIFWSEQREAPYVDSVEHDSVLGQTVEQLQEYFRGERRTFTLPLSVEGTPFQKSVWTALSQIPYGTTCSYQEIARQLGREKAMRAVGTANGRNPLSIVVPCHRVINANGALGGYAGGLAVKTKLLGLERPSR